MSKFEEMVGNMNDEQARVALAQVIGVMRDIDVMEVLSEELSEQIKEELAQRWLPE